MGISRSCGGGGGIGRAIVTNHFKGNLRKAGGVLRKGLGIHALAIASHKVAGEANGMVVNGADVGDRKGEPFTIGIADTFGLVILKLVKEGATIEEGVDANDGGQEGSQ